MKKLSFLFAILLSVSAHAGPEEHRDAQRCYTLTSVDAKRATENIPSQICVETVSINTSTETIYVYSYFYGLIFENVTLNSLSRKNEDALIFKSSGIFYSKENEQTGQLEQLSVLVSGQVDNDGVANPAALTIEVKQNRRYNPHSSINSTVYQYQIQ